MVRTLIGILLLVFGAGSVLWNNRTDLSSISQAEWIALVVCLPLCCCFGISWQHSFTRRKQLKKSRRVYTQ